MPKPPRPSRPNRRSADTDRPWAASSGAPALAIFLALPLLALLLLNTTCRTDDDPVTLPDGMLGRWITKEPSHADRFLDIAEERIEFGTGGNRSEAYDILAVTVDNTQEVPLYTIEYMTPTGTSTVSLWYQERHGVLRLNHRWDMMWRRAGDDSEIPEEELERTPPAGARTSEGDEVP